MKGTKIILIKEGYKNERAGEVFTHMLSRMKEEGISGLTEDAFFSRFSYSCISTRHSMHFHAATVREIIDAFLDWCDKNNIEVIRETR